MSASRSGGADNLCEVIDNHADLIDLAAEDVTIPANGTLRITKTDGSTVDNQIPFFSNFIIDGLVLSLQSPPNADQLNYTSGDYQIDGVRYQISPSGTISLTAGDAVNPRIDIVYVDTSGNINYTAGTPAASPVAPVLPANSLLIGFIGVEIGADGSGGGYIITQVNLSELKIGAGRNNGDTLRWNKQDEIWEPNPSFLININDIFGFNTQMFNANLDSSLPTSDPRTNTLTPINNAIYNNGQVINRSIERISSSTTLTDSNYIIYCESSTFISLTLPLISATEVRPETFAKEYYIKNSDVDFVEIGTGTARTTDGRSSIILTPGESVWLKLDIAENDWKVLSSNRVLKNGVGFYLNDTVALETIDYTDISNGIEQWFTKPNNFVYTLEIGDIGDIDFQLSNTFFSIGDIITFRRIGVGSGVVNIVPTGGAEVDGSTADVPVTDFVRVLKTAANEYITLSI